MSKKPKKTSLPHLSQSGIQATKLNTPGGISFSFKYYEDSHDKFNCHGKTGVYWQALVNRLKDLSGLTYFISLSKYLGFFKHKLSTVD